jgi:hypothetical protein
LYEEDPVPTAWDGVTNYIETRGSESGTQARLAREERAVKSLLSRRAAAGGTKPAAVLREAAVPRPRFRLKAIAPDEARGSAAADRLFDGSRILGRGSDGPAPQEEPPLPPPFAAPQPLRFEPRLDGAGGLRTAVRPRPTASSAATVSLSRFYVGLLAGRNEEPLAFIERASFVLRAASGFELERAIGQRPAGGGVEIVVAGSLPSQRLGELRRLPFVSSVDAVPEPAAAEEWRDAPREADPPAGFLAWLRAGWRRLLSYRPN